MRAKRARVMLGFVLVQILINLLLPVKLTLPYLLARKASSTSKMTASMAESKFQYVKMKNKC